MSRFYKLTSFCWIASMVALPRNLFCENQWCVHSFNEKKLIVIIRFERTTIKNCRYKVMNWSQQRCNAKVLVTLSQFSQTCAYDHLPIETTIYIYIWTTTTCQQRPLGWSLYTGLTVEVSSLKSIPNLTFRSFRPYLGLPYKLVVQNCKIVSYFFLSKYLNIVYQNTSVARTKDNLSMKEL